MFENYLATKDDIHAIEDGLETVEQKELDFVFKNRNLLKNVVVISYDSVNLYLWTKVNLSMLETFPWGISQYRAYKIPHNVELKDEWQTGWRVGLSIKPFQQLLPKILLESKFKAPVISGGLLNPFIKLQKKKKRKNNPYITRESYLATIVHEFGHIYWNQSKLWWYSSKKDNIQYLKTAKQLYKQEKTTSKTSIHFPTTIGISELYAYCTEYCTSKHFYLNHNKNLDIFAEERLRQLIAIEGKKDLEREDSVLSPTKFPHDFALVFGKTILTQYPKTWPQILTDHPAIKLSSD